MRGLWSLLEQARSAMARERPRKGKEKHLGYFAHKSAVVLTRTPLVIDPEDPSQ